VSVLNVVHRIFLVFAGGHLDVEIQRPIVIPGQEVKPNGVRPDLLDQFLERNIIAFTRGHRNRFPVPVEIDELIKLNFKTIDGMSQKGESGPYTVLVTVVIVTPDVDVSVVTAFVFFVMVEKIVSEVRGITVVFD